ncbi:hypothetical protein ACFQBQ_04370 [Granulicella cerasi]|uniref:Uncharacterized protein n=1 Tax=Granulicella cerasi TaxID=741063 RepID=A0ABW1Z6X5_9BACT
MPAKITFEVVLVDVVQLALPSHWKKAPHPTKAGTTANTLSAATLLTTARQFINPDAPCCAIFRVNPSIYCRSLLLCLTRNTASRYHLTLYAQFF